MFKPSVYSWCLLVAGLGMGTATVGATPRLAPEITRKQAINLGIQGQAPSWQELWSKRPPVEAPPRGSRGPLCAIAPGSSPHPTPVWNRQPMLVWRGTIGRVEVYQHNQQLWQQQLRNPTDRVVYTGLPLEPGQDYYWLLFDIQSRPIARLPFRVVGTDRAAIATDLQQLELRLKRQAASPEDIARKRADYFASRQLWTDVLQEAFSVANPSPALSQFLQTLPTQICQAGQAF